MRRSPPVSELTVPAAAPRLRLPSRAWSALADSATMAGRCLRMARRHVDVALTSLLLPVLLMLLFVYLFGGAIQTGTRYVTYVVPGVLLLCAGFGASMTAVSVTTDMTGGIVDRFRSMDVAGASVLAGHVAASVVRNLASTVLVFGVAFLIGFRPSAGPLDWLAAVGMLLLFILAISWLSAAVGLLARSPEAAGGFSFLVMFLPYPSSAFVPIDTMPSWIHARPAPRPPARDQPPAGGRLVPRHPGRLGGRLRRAVPPPHDLTAPAGPWAHHHSPIYAQTWASARSSTAFSPAPRGAPSRPTRVVLVQEPRQLVLGGRPPFGHDHAVRVEHGQPRGPPPTPGKVDPHEPHREVASVPGCRRRDTYRQDATRSCPGGGEAVDVVTEPGLKARIRQRVLAEAVAV